MGSSRACEISLFRARSSARHRWVGWLWLMSARGFGERMHEVLILAIKGLAGGGLVVAFALLSEGVAPKRFAGLFSAAPAAALAGLAVVPLDKGAHEAHENATGMIAG